MRYIAAASPLRGSVGLGMWKLRQEDSVVRDGIIEGSPGLVDEHPGTLYQTLHLQFGWYTLFMSLCSEI